MERLAKEVAVARYKELCARRDAVLETIAPLRAAQDAAVAREQEARQEAMALAARVQEVLGGRAWLTLKHDIGRLASIAEPVLQAARELSAE